MFIITVICCMGGALIVADIVDAFMDWWETRPIVEEKSTPLYIKKEIPDNELN